MKEGSATDGNKLFRELVGLFLFFSGLFLAVSVFSYDPQDPSFFYMASDSRASGNLAGVFGAHTAGLFIEVFGLGGFLAPLLCLYLGAICFAPRLALAWWRGLGIILLALTLTTWSSSPWAMQHISIRGASGGGLLGREIFRWSQFLLRPLGSLIVWSFILVASVQLTMGISWTVTGRGIHDLIRGALQRRRVKTARREQKENRRKESALSEPLPAFSSPIRGEASPDMKEAVETGQNFAFTQLFRPDPEGGDANSGGDDSSDCFLPDNGANEDRMVPGSESNYLQEDMRPVQPKPVRQAGLAMNVPAKPTVPARTYQNLPLVADEPEEEELWPIDISLPLPAFELLATPEEGSGQDMDRLEEKARDLAACLSDFGVNGEVHRIVPGPVVTMFEYKPAPGVKLARITNLSDDVAMALRALAVRIDPIPGKDLVGIEIPNEDREVVSLREVFESDAFRGSKSRLTLALGKNIQGQPYVADLAKMPHLLVAGATGAGKSVCLNGILLSLLYKANPDEVKMLLVDPKRIELSVYADLPHLVHPVVTEMSLAKNALEWAVFEMEKRYEAMAKLGVRNIDGFNQKLAKLDIQSRPDLEDLAPLPYLVIIIDELADLMMTAAKEAEMAIVRLAQLARAAGIHLILATQRPSVDVVTGLIKANFPTRISFQVTSKHDSRTILDTVGAENLLGRGDMLYKPSGGKFLRLHGAYVSEEEIARVVDFWKTKVPQSFELDFKAWQQDSKGETAEGAPGGLDSDPIYNEAVDFVMEQGKASISLIQRRFRIGFNRAARYIEQMEMDGLLGPQEGSKPRMVLKTRE